MVKVTTNSVISRYDPGNDTNDKIFVLSLEEREKYFYIDEEKSCYPTEYVKTKELEIDEDDGTCDVWLRGSWKYADDINGVRPAMWIDLES